MTALTITTPGSGRITIGGTSPNDPPAGATSIQIECWGAGGTAFPMTSAEAGGGSGAYSRKNAWTVANGDVLDYKVAEGQTPNGGSPGATYVLTPSLVTVCLAKSGIHREAGTADGTGDLQYPGAVGASAQGGGGSRGGSGGSSSAGPNGPGAVGVLGSHAAGGSGAPSGAGVGGGGAGAVGGVANQSGGNGVQPGGGAGGGGSGAGSNAGQGGHGQIRLSW